MDEAERALVFVKHIEKHLKETYQGEDARVVCKICGKTIDEIYEEAKKET